MPGFGRPFHKPDDPRPPLLFPMAEKVGLRGHYVDLSHRLSGVVDREIGRHLTINATGAIGALMLEIGTPAGCRVIFWRQWRCRRLGRCGRWRRNMFLIRRGGRAFSLRWAEDDGLDQYARAIGGVAAPSGMVGLRKLYPLQMNCLGRRFVAENVQKVRMWCKLSIPSPIGVTQCMQCLRPFARNWSKLPRRSPLLFQAMSLLVLHIQIGAFQD